MRDVRVRFVIFEDGSQEQDPEFATESTERDSGELAQLENIVPLLEEANKSEDLEGLLAKIRQLPDAAPAGKSFLYEQGMRRAKETIELEVKRLDKKNVATVLQRLQEETAKTIARLRRQMKKS